MENIQISTEDHPIVLNLMNQKLSLPPQSTISPYSTQYKKKPTKQALKKKRYTNFFYYNVNNQIWKVLFLDQEKYLLVSKFPFIKQINQVNEIKQLNDQGPSRLTICQSILIGELQSKIVTRKLMNCKIDQKTKEIDTIEDHFQFLTQKNIQKFNKINNDLINRSQSQSLSIRVIISEMGEAAAIIDYELFFAQKQYAKNYVKTQQGEIKLSNNEVNEEKGGQNIEIPTN